MKRVLIIILCCTEFIISCSTPEMPFSDVMANGDIFSVQQNNISNGQSIHFNLPSAGVYNLTLIDKNTNQVISRERFTGQKGENVKKIFTKSIQSRYLYLLLEDVTKNELGKTTIIIN